MTPGFLAGLQLRRAGAGRATRPARRWPALALVLLLMNVAATAAIADRVVLRSGPSLQGTIANRAEVLRAPGLVTAIELRLELSGADAASVRTLTFARSEVEFVVLEDGRLETIVPLSAPAPSSARTSVRQRVWLALTVSHSSYDMADLNDLIASPGAPPTLASLEPIGSGLGAGMEAGVDLPSGFTVGLAWDRILANSDAGDAGAATLSVSAFLLRAFGSYAVARSDRGSLRFGVSLGAVVPSVILDHADPALADHRDRVVGVAPAGEVFGGGELQLYRWMGASLDTGYRRAVSRDVPIAALDLRDLDYSGWFVRAGVQFFPPD